MADFDRDGARVQRYAIATSAAAETPKNQSLLTRVMAIRFTLCYASLILSQRRHHHVESVHFTTSAGKALHPALAVVQTPGREYYILKDNGMQVGCEEDGVAPVWMSLLGCNSLGGV